MQLRLHNVVLALSRLILFANAQSLNLTGVSISSLTYGGTGCPQGTIGTLFRPNTVNTTNLILVLGDQFLGSGFGGPVGGSSNSLRLNCQMSVDLQHPSTLQFGVLSRTWGGSAELDAGVSGSITITDAFPDTITPVSTRRSLTGPFSGVFDLSKVVTEQDVVWSSCDGSLPVNINLQLSFTSSAGGYGEIDTDPNYIMTFLWRTCV